MKGQLEHLVRLQEIDAQLSRIRAEKARQPLQLEDAQRPLRMLQKTIEQARAALEAASKTKREKERDLQTQEEYIEKLKARQTAIKTNKEYQALLKELGTAQESKGRLEEALLLLMEELDNQTKRVVQQEQSVKDAEQEFQSKERTLAQEAIRLEEALVKLEGERAEVAKQVQKNFLRDYEHLKTIRKDLAVVPVVHGSCGGCHINLPPQLVAEVRMVEQILTCSNCHRILYWPHPIQQTANSR